MSIKQWIVSEPYLAVSCKLGEGPYYSEDRNELRFLDINDSKLYIIDLSKGPSSVRKIDTIQKVGVTADIEGVDSSKIILTGAKDGVTKFNLDSGEHTYISKYWSGPGAEEKARRMRSNDGAVDSTGRFWVEAFVDPEIEEPTNEGKVFRLDDGTKLKTMYENIVIPNGITWHEAESTMHLSDTTINKIWAFDYTAQTGDIANKRVFYEHQGEGHPDGHAIDAAGNLWQALYGGSKVIRISREGDITGEVLLPTRNVTCPVFVGTDLFITTAMEEEPDKNPESARFAGNLFKVNVGVRGVPQYKARLS